MLKTAKHRCNCFSQESSPFLYGLRREAPSTERVRLERLLNVLSRAAANKSNNPQRLWAEKDRPDWWTQVSKLPWKNPREHPKDNKKILKEKIDVLERELQARNLMTDELKEEVALHKENKKLDLELKSDFEAVMAKCAGLHFMLDKVSSRMGGCRPVMTDKVARYISETKDCLYQCFNRITAMHETVKAFEKRKQSLWHTMGVSKSILAEAHDDDLDTDDVSLELDFDLSMLEEGSPSRRSSNTSLGKVSQSSLGKLAALFSGKHSGSSSEKHSSSLSGKPSSSSSGKHPRSTSGKLSSLSSGKGSTLSSVESPSVPIVPSGKSGKFKSLLASFRSGSSAASKQNKEARDASECRQLQRSMSQPEHYESDFTEVTDLGSNSAVSVDLLSVQLANSQHKASTIPIPARQVSYPFPPDQSAARSDRNQSWMEPVPEIPPSDDDVICLSPLQQGANSAYTLHRRATSEQDTLRRRDHRKQRTSPIDRPKSSGSRERHVPNPNFDPQPVRLSPGVYSPAQSFCSSPASYRSPDETNYIIQSPSCSSPAADDLTVDTGEVIELRTVSGQSVVFLTDETPTYIPMDTNGTLELDTNGVPNPNRNMQSSDDVEEISDLARTMSFDDLRPTVTEPHVVRNLPGQQTFQEAASPSGLYARDRPALRSLEVSMQKPKTNESRSLSKAIADFGELL